jgi:hypothetical protein
LFHPGEACRHRMEVPLDEGLDAVHRFEVEQALLKVRRQL